MPNNLLNRLPPVFRRITEQNLPDCSDPIANPVDNPLDHSRLMVGDIITIPTMKGEESLITFKTVNFVVGQSTIRYKQIRDSI